MIRPNRQGLHNHFIYTGFISKLNMLIGYIGLNSVTIFDHEPGLWYKTMLVPSMTQNELNKIAFYLGYSKDFS